MRPPEFPKGLRWFNSGELQMKALRDEKKVVLIDFWTYSCVNCIRTLPYIKEWHARYKDKGLTIIGVHTPEFAFEKDATNVERAIKQFGIEYPVVMDSDYQIWSLYANNVWPRKYLINHEGHMIYDHSGEGGYKETEEKIQEALRAVLPEVKLPEPTNDEGAGGICYPTTPETYLGSLRGRPGREWNFTGEWKVHPEYVEHETTTSDFKDALVLKFQGTEVNVVAESLGERPAKIRVLLDNKPYRDLEIHDARMYELFRESHLAKGTLSIQTKDERVRFYAFTFGGCVT